MENRPVPLDTHQHFWRYNETEYAWIDDSMASLRRDFMPDDVSCSMSAAGFGAAIAVQVRQSLDETRWLLELSDRHDSIAGVIGWVDLQAANALDQLLQFTNHPKLVGVRHIVQSEPDSRFLLRPAFCNGIAILEEFNLTYDILIYPRHLPVAAEFVQRFPRQRFVLDHLAKPDIRRAEIQQWAGDLRRLAAFPNVVAKLSGLVTEAEWTRWTREQIAPYLDVAFDSFGPDRLMIGSDWPVCTLAGDYAGVMSVITEYFADRRIKEDDRRAILGGNAQRLWNLPDRRTAGAAVKEGRR